MTRSSSPPEAASRKRRRPATSRRSSYLEESERPGTSLIFLAPLIVLYELYALGIVAGSAAGVPADSHITAFLLIEELFRMMGAAGRHLPALALVAMLLGAHIARRDPWEFHPGTLFAMAVESIGWALPLLVLGWMLARFLPLAGDSPVGALAGQSAAGRWALLCIGAGVYEEMVFRLIGVTVLMLIVCDLFGVPRGPGVVLILIGTGTAFAMYHYLSPVEDFHLRTFLFRTAAGAYFGGLFLTRGFGVTAASHAAYDVVVVGLMVS